MGDASSKVPLSTRFWPCFVFCTEQYCLISPNLDEISFYINFIHQKVLSMLNNWITKCDSFWARAAAHSVRLLCKTTCGPCPASCLINLSRKYILGPILSLHYLRSTSRPSEDLCSVHQQHPVRSAGIPPATCTIHLFSHPLMTLNLSEGLERLIYIMQERF